MLPTVPFGVQTGQLDIPFCINMNPSTQRLVLRDVAQALDKRMRDTDLVARIGGDEFAVICPETGINELMTIRRQLSEQTTREIGEVVGLSIGVSEYVPSDDDATSILARADESMYRVKRGEATALPA